MILVKELIKSFDGFRALDGLDLSAPKGAVYGLVGPNGAGKSTLIRHLAGIYRQDSGEVLIDGEPVYENPAVKARIIVEHSVALGNAVRVPIIRHVDSLKRGSLVEHILHIGHA